MSDYYLTNHLLHVSVWICIKQSAQNKLALNEALTDVVLHMQHVDFKEYRARLKIPCVDHMAK